MAERIDSGGLAPDVRDKYRDLSRKYAALVERLERRTEDRMVIYRLGFLGLRASGAGLCIVKRGQVTLANAPWHHLERAAARGSLVVLAGGAEERTYAGLYELALGEGARLLAAHEAQATVRARVGERTLEVRLENLGKGTLGPVAMLVQDVTQRAAAEQELLRTREALFQQEHLRLLGQLASSVAHDLANTMRGVSMLLSAMRRKAGSPRRDLLTLEKMVRVASDTLRRLTEFARAGRLMLGPIDLSNLIGDACETVRVYTLGTGGGAIIDCKVPALPLVRGTISEVSHLFVNLLLNAIEAMPNGGVVRVRASKADELVRVVVEDEGTGIAPVNRPRLFEPFFTTKENGTGLGLWLAAGTMKRLGGTIAFADRPRGGTAFTLEFPCADGDAQAAPRRRAKAFRAAGPRAPARPAARR